MFVEILAEERLGFSISITNYLLKVSDLPWFDLSLRI